MSPKLERPLTVWNLIVGLAVIVVGGVFTAGMAWASVASDIQELTTKSALPTHNEAEIHALKEDMREMKTDVKWIREKLDK